MLGFTARHKQHWSDMVRNRAVWTKRRRTADMVRNRAVLTKRRRTADMVRNRAVLTKRRRTADRATKQRDGEQLTGLRNKETENS